MSKYDFILDGMTYSFSSVTSWEQCAYAFKLNYIDGEEKTQNFYGEYGNKIHSLMQAFLEDELELHELPKVYAETYSESVVSPLPGFLKNKWNDYYDKGLLFFENLDFDKSKYEILIIEDKIDLEHGGIYYVVKPDLVVREKETGKNILIDFKTANGYKPNGKVDTKKLEGYLKQFYLYCYGLWQSKGIEIDEIHIWFVTNGKTEIIKFNPLKCQETFDWFIETVEKIKNDDEFRYNNTNSFWCNNICSLREICEYKSKTNS